VPVKLLVTALALLALLPAAAQAAKKPRYYVSVGDSLSVGWQPQEDGTGARTNEGYVDFLFRTVRRDHARLRSKKLGCPGETARTFLEGGICVYRQGSQIQAAEAFLKKHRGRIALVTIDIGANDVASCGQGGSIDFSCYRNGNASIDENVPKIVSRLRRAAGRRTEVAGMTYYNPFLQQYLRGDDQGKQNASLSVSLVRELNGRLTRYYMAGRFSVADVGTAFQTYVPFERTRNYPPYGDIPVAVAAICDFTWMCAAEPQGLDIHANRAGYRLIARTFARAID
jgi:lysophospholipase L1-like esterase